MKHFTVCLVAACFLAGAGFASAQDAKIKLQGSCVTAECHPDMGKQKYGHGPVNMRQCQPCHVPVNNEHNFANDPKGRALCAVCHEMEAPKKVAHKPFETDCSLCHDPHGGANRYFIRGGTGAEGCTKCHGDVLKGLSVLHGPVAQGECLACHTPHQSDHANLLVDPPKDQCLGCHVDFGARMKNAVSVHQPATGDCGGCHNAHGGTSRAFVKMDTQKLCSQCHQAFLAKTQQVKFPHLPVSEGKGCDNCHDFHASAQEKLLKKNASELCLACHNKPVQAKDRMLANVADQIEKSKFLHGPVQQKNCNGCHGAHGTDFPSILIKAFPKEFYAPYADKAYDLCFDCHDKKIVQNQRGAETAFRNGDRNLHYVHVNSQKGRSCRACHQEHASNQSHHIRDEVPFGRWTMQTQFTKTPTGGGCATGCHAKFKYDRENPVQGQGAS